MSIFIQDQYRREALITSPYRTAANSRDPVIQVAIFLPSSRTAAFAERRGMFAQSISN
jgi:hypothetical protein